MFPQPATIRHVEAHTKLALMLDGAYKTAGDGRRGWVDLTEEDKTMCGIPSEDVAAHLFDYGHQAAPAALCKACVDAAARAGRPVPSAG